MNKIKSFKRLQEDAHKRDSYWVESSKLDFSIALERQRKSKKISYADLAKKISTSKAYITKVFRGDSNFTIETMVKLVRAVDGVLQITIAPREPVRDSVGNMNELGEQIDHPFSEISDVRLEIGSDCPGTTQLIEQVSPFGPYIQDYKEDGVILGRSHITQGISYEQEKTAARDEGRVIKIESTYQAIH